MLIFMWICGGFAFIGTLVANVMAKELLLQSTVPAATIHGVVGCDDDVHPSLVLHEKIHVWTLIPWLAMVVQAFTQPTLMLCGYGFWHALWVAALINIAFRWVGEFIADLGAFLVYGRTYIRELVKFTDQHDPINTYGKFQVLSQTAMQYPPYRFLLYVGRKNNA